MTDMSISNFLAKMSPRGLAYPNRYKIRIHPPTGILAFASGVSPYAVSGRFQQAINFINAGGVIEMMAAQVSLPSRIFDMMELRTYGVSQRIPFSVAISETLTMMFLSSSWYAERHYFELWQSIVANVRSNTMNYPKEYLGRVEIIALDKEGKETYQVMLEDAIPTSVQQIDLGYATNNVPVFTPVSWTFKNWSSPVPQGG